MFLKIKEMQLSLKVSLSLVVIMHWLSCDLTTLWWSVVHLFASSLTYDCLLAPALPSSAWHSAAWVNQCLRPARMQDSDVPQTSPSHWLQRWIPEYNTTVADVTSGCRPKLYQEFNTRDRKMQFLMIPTPQYLKTFDINYDSTMTNSEINYPC